MNGKKQMNADRSCDASDWTSAVIGAFYRVYNELGYGFLEAVYRRALAHELRRRGVGVECERVIDVWYDGVRVGVFRADLMVAERVIVEIKTAQALGDADRKQLLNYLHATDVEVGLLLNFGPRATFQRLAFSNSSKSARSR